MRISIEVDRQALASEMRNLDADLKRVGKLALRSMSDGLREGHRQYLRDNLDRPTAYSEDSLYIVGSPSSVPEIVVGVKDRQAAYLGYAYEGGTRERAIVPSDDARLDGRGNMPRGYTRAIAASGGWWMIPKRFFKKVDARACALSVLGQPSWYGNWSRNE